MTIIEAPLKKDQNIIIRLKNENTKLVGKLVGWLVGCLFRG
jgi:hypothetical protein